jgi:hypothetical protein
LGNEEEWSRLARDDVEGTLIIMWLALNDQWGKDKASGGSVSCGKVTESRMRKYDLISARGMGGRRVGKCPFPARERAELFEKLK